MSNRIPQNIADNLRKPVHITADSRVFIGDDEFPYAIADYALAVKHGRYNELTLTLCVGDVTIERKTGKFPVQLGDDDRGGFDPISGPI